MNIEITLYEDTKDFENLKFLSNLSVVTREAARCLANLIALRETTIAQDDLGCFLYVTLQSLVEMTNYPFIQKLGNYNQDFRLYYKGKRFILSYYLTIE